MQALEIVTVNKKGQERKYYIYSESSTELMANFQKIRIKLDKLGYSMCVGYYRSLDQVLRDIDGKYN